MAHTHRRQLLFWSLAGILSAAFVPGRARACGCLAPPDVSVPFVQAGESLLFSQQNGMVTAHIKIQYQGKPADFGWLLPLPSVPTGPQGEVGITLGTDELFSVLVGNTQPHYTPQFSSDCQQSGPGVGLGCGAEEASSAQPGPFVGQEAEDMGAASPLVMQASIGPYDYAVLHADNMDELLKWLSDNRYVVPDGTGKAVAPYIRPGAYFLALKLHAGEPSGSLQPVVVRYQSDLPMIPIVLTQVGATPHMGIQVFLLGQGRGIPRNYYHVVLNEAQLDWYGGFGNYNDVVIAAVAEAKGKHAFVTEYAGTSSLVSGILDRAGRFGTLDQLRSFSDPAAYVSNALDPAHDLVQNGQPVSSLLPTILFAYVPEPAALSGEGISLWDYYQRISYFLGVDRQQNPARYADIADALSKFDPNKLTDELRNRIVNPTLDAGALLRQQPYLTRLYTTLSPEDMTEDPVFSINPGLPDVSFEHTGTLVQHCDGSTTLTTSAGDSYLLPPAAVGGSPGTGQPFSRRIEILRDTGAPEVVVDHPPPPLSGQNQAADGQGCTAARTAKPGVGVGVNMGGPLGSLGLLLGCAGLLWLRRRRRA